MRHSKAELSTASNPHQNRAREGGSSRIPPWHSDHTHSRRTDFSPMAEPSQIFLLLQQNLSQKWLGCLNEAWVPLKSVFGRGIAESWVWKNKTRDCGSIAQWLDHQSLLQVKKTWAASHCCCLICCHPDTAHRPQHWARTAVLTESITLLASIQQKYSREIFTKASGSYTTVPLEGMPVITKNYQDYTNI